MANGKSSAPDARPAHRLARNDVTNPLKPPRVLILCEPSVEPKDDFDLQILLKKTTGGVTFGPIHERVKVSGSQAVAVEFDNLSDTATYEFMHSRGPSKGGGNPAWETIEGVKGHELLSHAWKNPPMPSFSPPKKQPSTLKGPETSPPHVDDLVLRVQGVNFPSVRVEEPDLGGSS